MKLILIRHGQTTGDIEDRYGGAYDDALSPAGEQQVQILVGQLKKFGIQKVYSSPLLRAQQTAEPLAVTFGCRMHVIEGLRERDQYGPLTGMTKVEARKTYPELVAVVKDRLNTLPGAESYTDAADRMKQAFEEVAMASNDCVAAVWHGGGMRVLFREILQRGELQGDCGDCCWVLLEKVGNGFEIREMSGLRLVN